MELIILWSGLLFLFNDVTRSDATGSHNQQKGIFAGSVRIESQDFNVTETVTKSKSLIVCGARFSIAIETNKLTEGANGFYFNEENRECQIGKVSFPVQEVENGGIRVHGISK